MGKLSAKKTNEALNILENYSGNNTYIKTLKYYTFTKQIKNPSDFELQYTLQNHNFEIKNVDKIVKVVDWFGDKKREEWNYQHPIKKLKILQLLGETDNNYHVTLLYKQNQQEPVTCFIPKSVLLDELFLEDFNKLDIDFEKYNNLTRNLPQKRILKPYQETAIKFLLTRKECLLCDDQGLGKSASMIVAAIESKAKNVLIVCPASVKYTLKRELMFYVNESEIGVVEGISDKNKSELEIILGYEKGKSGLKLAELQIKAKEMGKWYYDKKYIIVNYDILSEFYEIPKSRSKENIQKAYEKSPMLQNKFDLVILDEIHRLSNKTSDRYKIINDFLKRNKQQYIWGVSGTPLTNRPINLFNILHIIGHPLGQNFEFFVKNFCDGKQIPMKGEKQRLTTQYLQIKKKNTWFQLTDDEREDLKEYINGNAKKIWLTNGSSNLEDLKERVKNIYIRRLKKDMDMVQKNIKTRYYDLTSEQRNKYENLWEEYQNQEGRTDEKREVAEQNKSLIEGGVFRQYLGVEMTKNTIKLAEEYIEDGEKVLIITCYENEMDILSKHFGNSCVTFSGKSTPKQKQQAEYDFMNNPNIKVFIGQIIACGVGLTLTAASIGILNSYSFVPADNIQAIDRIHRISSHKDVTIYFQIFSDTILEGMWDTVISKSLIIDTVIKTEDEKQ